MPKQPPGGGVPLSRLESPAPARPAAPTDALPGSPEKLAVLASRARRRQSLRCPGDALDDPARALEFRTSGNGARVATGVRAVDPEGAATSRVPGDTFAARLRRLRQRSGMSPKALASRVGVSVRAVEHWESGSREPAWSQAVRVVQALGCAFEELAGGQP